MRKRWQVLSAIASFGVSAFFFGLLPYRGFHVNSEWVLGFAGFAGACGIALWAAIVDYQQRWPAAVALIAFAPFAQRLVGFISNNGIVLAFDLLSLTVIASSLGTVIAAVVILMMKVPPSDERLARAKLR